MKYPTDPDALLDVWLTLAETQPTIGETDAQ
jgi:hypothetical protein